MARESDLPDGNGLLLQLMKQPINQFSMQAKKAKAFQDPVIRTQLPAIGYQLANAMYKNRAYSLFR